jgi:gliding motility-associated-like protein
MTVHFDFTCDKAVSWIWNFGEGVTDTAQNPSYTFWEYGHHRVLLEVNSGAPDFCTDTASILIFTDLIVEIDYNDVLTPNGDGTNDYFEITSFGLQTLNVKIYDRWGKKVYEITEMDGKWDGLIESGKEALDGVYYFYLKALGVDGLDYERSGSITLIRDVINTYPNPVSDKVNLKLGSQVGDELTIQVFSLEGQERISLSAKRSDIISIDVSDLPDGFYILRLTDGAKIIYTKILKVSQ